MARKVGSVPNERTGQSAFFEKYEHERNMLHIEAAINEGGTGGPRSCHFFAGTRPGQGQAMVGNLVPI